MNEISIIIHVNDLSMIACPTVKWLNACYFFFPL